MVVKFCEDDHDIKSVALVIELFGRKVVESAIV